MRQVLSMHSLDKCLPKAGTSMTSTSDTVFSKCTGVGESASLPGNRALSHLCRSPPTPTHAALLSVSLSGGDARPRTRYQN